MKISFIIAFLFTFINAQYSGNFITGQISGLLLNDETSAPVEYATISIFKKEPRIQGEIDYAIVKEGDHHRRDPTHVNC